MFDPPHPGKLVRSCIEESNWTVAAAAAERLGVGRTSLSRPLNGKHGISPALALALEDVGWSTAEHWLRVQAIYDLAQARAARGTA